jgi:sigma-B regulation protein RsbU (phosphoserine phosphatase)
MTSVIDLESILIVDDMKYNQMLFEDTLKSVGYNNIKVASSGKEVYELLNHYKPDLILLDLFLADTNGLEICKFIRCHPNLKDIPIIVQSSANYPELKQQAFDFGANDFINKPIDKLELIARVKVQLVQNQLYKKLVETNSRMLYELEEARKILQTILPDEHYIEEVSKNLGINISAYYKPSSELGGDFYGISQKNKCLNFYMWDFSGHGITAAINTFRLHSTIMQNGLTIQEPANFLDAINNILFKILERKFFATMFCGIIDYQEKKLFYSHAASPSPLLISFKNKNYKLLDGKSFPLGAQNKIKYESYVEDLKDWDLIIIYSDALIETIGRVGTMLSMQDLANSLLDRYEDAAKVDTKKILRLILLQFNQGYAANLADDLTLLLISLKPDSNS